MRISLKAKLNYLDEQRGEADMPISGNKHGN